FKIDFLFSFSTRFIRKNGPSGTPVHTNFSKFFTFLLQINLRRGRQRAAPNSRRLYREELLLHTPMAN
ncbi:MAG: hypothetical protein IKC59_02025, partial [Clostridia bacterium]|nr:hypothetical protein [Clostridia bacterium]